MGNSTGRTPSPDRRLRQHCPIVGSPKPLERHRECQSMRQWSKKRSEADQVKQLWTLCGRYRCCTEPGERGDVFLHKQINCGQSDASVQSREDVKNQTAEQISTCFS